MEKRTERDQVRKWILYLPNPGVTLPPVSTGLKIAGKPLVLNVGTKKQPGRLIGMGVNMGGAAGGDKQMWRMDYHSWHNDGGIIHAKEASRWEDKPYHFHVGAP